MTRPLKFRAWNPKTKFMTEPFSIQIKNKPLTETYTYPDQILQQFTGLLDKNGKEIYEGDIVQADRYFANQRWWRTVEEIPKIKREVRQQKKDTYKDVSVVRYYDGEFQIFGKSLRDFREWDGRRKTFVVKKWETSGSGYTSDYHEGILHIEIIGNIYENPELLKGESK